MAINVRKLYSLDGHNDCIYTLESAATSNLFYSAAGDGMIVIWDLEDPETGKLVAKMNNSVYSLHYHSSDILLAGQNYEGIHFINTANHQDEGSVKISKSQIFDIKTYQNNIFIASGDGTLYILDFYLRAFVKKIKLSDKSIRRIAINEKLGDLALGLSDNTIRILDLEDYKQKYVIHAHKLSVFALAYDPNSDQLISGSRDAHLKTWSPQDQYKLDQSVVAHMYAINDICMKPSNDFMVTGSMDKTVKVWDLEQLKLLKVIDQSRHGGHVSSVNSLLWTEYNDQILSCSDDRKISVWDLDFN
jgi:WD40 repeat protein